ncbi:MAG: hypothetical protein N2509_08770, partial [Treponemataceae bacterium]|nr:hypothetical protein [Treponemataceae bacterium]
MKEIQQFKHVTFQLVRNHPVVLALLLFILLFSALYPQRFLTPLNFSTVLRQFVTLTLFALGPSLVVITGAMDLSYVGIWMLGGILTWLLIPVVGKWAILIFPLLGLITGLTIGLIHVRAKIPSFILTLSLLIVYWGLTATLSGGYPRPVRGYEWITAPLIPHIPTPVLWSIPIMAVAIFLARYT